MIVILKQWSLKISPSTNLFYFYLTTAVIIMGNKVLLRRIKCLKINNNKFAKDCTGKTSTFNEKRGELERYWSIMKKQQNQTKICSGSGIARICINFTLH